MRQESAAEDTSTIPLTEVAAGTPEAFQHRLPIDGRWKVVARLGGGSQGTAFAARDLELDRLVVVKVVHPSVISPARFKREGRLLARINDEHVVRIFNAGCCPIWGWHLVTELVKGHTLKEVIAEYDRRDRPLPLRRGVGIFLAVARALVALGSHGIAHRDIKPSNIIVPESGRPKAKVIDLGIGKVLANADDSTTEGSVLGTPAYMAPEAKAGKRTTVKVDIYGLGVSVWELFAGHHPFSGRFASAVATPLSVVRSDVPPELSDLIAEMMAPTPHQRPEAPEVVNRARQIRNRLRR
jgi:serine/threonine protein kinase